jgi:hypothetical protein
VEVLANRIGIMTFGRLRCLGTQQHLKAAYGGGYRLAINYDAHDGTEGKAVEATAGPSAAVAGGHGAGAAPEKAGGLGLPHFALPPAAIAPTPSLALAPGGATATEAAATGGGTEETAIPASARRALLTVFRLFPGAVLDAHFPGFASFILPETVPTASGGGSVPLPISRVFSLMTAHAAGAGVSDWGIGQVTLDTVFQRIVRHYRGPGSAGGGAPSDGEEEDEEESDAAALQAALLEEMEATVGASGGAAV